MSDNEQKPKRVWTEEQLAKRRATAAATKARKDAEKAAAAGAPVPAAVEEAAPAPAPEAPKKEKKPRKPKAAKEANGGAGVEEDAPAPEPAPATETPKKEKKEKKVPDAPKKEKKVAETAPENQTSWQPIIALVFCMKNDNYEEGEPGSEEWFEDRTYFANDDALRRYLTDRINNWSDDFSTMIRGIADDSPTQIAKYIDHIVGSPFLANHPLSEDFTVCRFSASLHQ
jgi:hypothetical protein